jgi:hypothetical protein
MAAPGTIVGGLSIVIFPSYLGAYFAGVWDGDSSWGMPVFFLVLALSTGALFYLGALLKDGLTRSWLARIGVVCAAALPAIVIIGIAIYGD